jgi:ribonuclease H2 subunit C
MLAIKKSETNTPSCAVNVLPCRIQHNGPVNASTRHWTPQESSDGKSNTAYFRGRKLNGRVVELPDGHVGMLCVSLSLMIISSIDLGFVSITSLFLPENQKPKGRRKKKTNSPSQTGSILLKTNTILPSLPTTTLDTTTPHLDEQQEEEEQDSSSTPETKLLNQLATFDKILVYGHEVQPDAQEDVYVKGMEEWIGLAGAVSFSTFSTIFGERG